MYCSLQGAAGSGNTVGVPTVEIFREMEILGVGKVVVGRKGYETRFRWNYKMTEVGKAAVGEIEEFEIADDLEESDEEEGGLVTHEFKIRKDVIAIVRAPSDLTEREAERLAKFIQTLPL